jgi:hypothetical protein
MTLLSARALLEDLTAQGVSLRLTDRGTILFQAKQTLTPAMWQALRDNKPALIALLSEQPQHTTTDNTPPALEGVHLKCDPSKPGHVPPTTPAPPPALPPVATRPALPPALIPLVQAACNDLLPGLVRTPQGLIPDLNRYTMAWGCVYLTGDTEHALEHLWLAHEAWKP